MGLWGAGRGRATPPVEDGVPGASYLAECRRLDEAAARLRPPWDIRDTRLGWALALAMTAP